MLGTEKANKTLSILTIIFKSIVCLLSEMSQSLLEILSMRIISIQDL
jgi:hypothetical protein